MIKIYLVARASIDAMKTKIIEYLRLWALSGALVFLPACASRTVPVTVQAVGPSPHEEANNSVHGFLVVYSAWGLVNENKAPVDHHSRYTVTSDDGKMNQVIINHIDRFDEGPVHLPLPPGSYKVSALSAHAGRVIVPVVIESRQTTSVYLDGQTRPPIAADAKASLIRLPDGQVVGWAANPEKK
jgi:hypothetical protein